MRRASRPELPRIPRGSVLVLGGSRLVCYEWVGYRVVLGEGFLGSSYECHRRPLMSLFMLQTVSAILAWARPSLGVKRSGIASDSVFLANYRSR